MHEAVTTAVPPVHGQDEKEKKGTRQAPPSASTSITFSDGVTVEKVEDKSGGSYWTIQRPKLYREDGTEWPWSSFTVRPCSFTVRPPCPSTIRPLSLHSTALAPSQYGPCPFTVRHLRFVTVDTLRQYFSSVFKSWTREWHRADLN